MSIVSPELDVPVKWTLPGNNEAILNYDPNRAANPLTPLVPGQAVRRPRGGLQ